MKNVGWLWAENYHPEDYDPDFGTSFDTDPRGWKRVEAGNHPLEDLFFSQKPEVLNKKTAFVVKKFRGLIVVGSNAGKLFPWVPYVRPPPL